MIQESIHGYVYHKQLVLYPEITTLVNNLSNSQSYYFLRYSHNVSGICMQLPTDRGEIEGQMFNAVCELRWKKYKSGYEVLLLSKQEFKFEGFEELTGKWEIYDRNAYWHGPDESKFPKGFKFKGINDENINYKEIPIQQRYFRDSITATIHFVALTVNEND
jgi:hypothetical protein